jgi:toxin ParE1/3/4
LRVRLFDEAKQELGEAAAVYELDVPGRGRRFLLAYRDASEHASKFPESGLRLQGRTRHELRTFPLHHFPYTIIATVVGDDLAIVAVAHQKREPGYWTGRLKGG